MLVAARQNVFTACPSSPTRYEDEKQISSSCTEIISICFFCTELGLVMLSLAKSRYACTNIAQFLCFLVNLKQRDVYRAGTSIHRGLAERLTHGEGDIGGADAGGCLDGQSLFLLGDFHCRAGRRCHCNLPQEHVDT